MSKKIQLLTFFLIFLLLTFCTYSIHYLIDYDFLIFISMVSNFFCFFIFFKFFNLLGDLDKESPNILEILSSKFVWSIILTLVHLFILTEYSPNLNNYFLDSFGKKQKAMIYNCHFYKGDEYCDYEYLIGDKYFRRPFENIRPEGKYRNYDSIDIVFYPKFPLISRFK